MKKIYIIFHQQSRILSHFCIKKKWKTMIVYKLSKTQQNNLKKQIFVIIDWEIAEVTQKNQVIHKIKYLRKILQDMYQKK